MQLPGRETRLREPPPTSLAVVVNELADALADHLDKPFALFGHSMGGAIAFELARELHRRGGPSPVRLLVSACRAPHCRPAAPPLAELPGAAFLAGVQERYGGFSEQIAQTPEALDLFLPILRADLAMIESFYRDAEEPLGCPVSVFAGSNDSTLRVEDLREWNRHTTEQCDLCVLPGGHFFINESPGAVLRALEARLEAALDGE
jgi:medium-chain acyl-[acyl-carrier-protein] hydrolase